MTIDEAIKHCLEVAEQNEFETRIYDELNRQGDEEYRNNHCQCAADHRQLAAWLKGYKELEAKHWDECRQIAHYDDEIKKLEAANIQSVVDYVQNKVLNYLFNKEREAESMPYSDIRQEQITTLREVIRYVEGIGDTNG